MDSPCEVRWPRKGERELMAGAARREPNGCPPSYEVWPCSPCLLVPKLLILDSGIDIDVACTTSERGHLVQAQGLHDRIRKHSECVAMPLSARSRRIHSRTQESNNINVHKSDLIQVHEYADVLIVHLSLYVADIGRLNSTTELQGCGLSVRLLFNPQHWLLPFSTHHRSLVSKIHVPVVFGYAWRVPFTSN